MRAHERDVMRDERDAHMRIMRERSARKDQVSRERRATIEDACDARVRSGRRRAHVVYAVMRSAQDI